MPEVSGRTLVMAVQAVDAELRRLEEELERAGDDADPDLQELTLCYSLAADDLQEAYLQALQSASNLPPYERLVARGSGKVPRP
ncbi:hypothetical protein [Pyxidicoccus caerfyrddinensis]|uniref:hypothetical protein n=1 Tax=Pyxidicoccus caerfyrddinensis TaxID=2709663 RepID=UPI0013D92FCB|nr:hypothetical protein [Pyxidicoccus caerfyrddinensis]